MDSCDENFSQLAKQSRDDFKDVHGLEDLSLKNFPEEILRQYIFRSVLLLQWISLKNTKNNEDDI